MWFIVFIFLLHLSSALDSNLCKLCTKGEGYSSCYKDGIYSQLALPSLNKSTVTDFSVIMSIVRTERKCKVIVLNSTEDEDPNWSTEPFYVFESIASPNKVSLRSNEGTIPPEGTYRILFAENRSLTFDVFYPALQRDTPFELNATNNYIPIPKSLRRCLKRSQRNASDPNIVSTLCTDFEPRPCFRHELNVSFEDASFQFVNVTFNSSLITPLNLTINCLLDAKVPMKGQDFFSSMRISFDPPNKFALMANLRLSGYGIDVSVLVISLFVVIFWVNAMVLLYRRRRQNGTIDLRKKHCRIDFFSNKRKANKFDKAISNIKTFPGWAKERYFDIARIEFGPELGRGQFGLVKRGKLSDGPHRKWDVAMKESSEDKDEDLLAEGKIMSVVGYHDHIVNLQCVSWNMRGNFYLILEYCHNGCIIDLLRNEYSKFMIQNGCTKGFYSVETLLIWARQIASGMEFLDSKNVIHGDLAGRNILLSLEYSAKISDFGLAHNLYQDIHSKKLTKRRLPIIWMGPETLLEGTITKKSDVWAFGILLWEIFTLGRQPYEGFSNEAVKAKLLDGVCTLEKPLLCPDGLWKLTQSLWNVDPSQRPDFKVIRRGIEDLIDQESSRVKEFNEGIKSMQKRFFDNPGYLTLQA